MTPEIKQRIAQIQRSEVPEGYKKCSVGIRPSEWNCQRLKEICIINPLKTKTKSKKTTFLGMSDVDESGHILCQNVVDTNQIKEGLTPFEKGDILVAKITPCFENGKGANTKELCTQTGAGSTEFHVLRSKINADFVFYHTLSRTFRRKLEIEMTGSAGQKRVQTDSLANYEIAVPCIQEQQKIAAILTTQDKIIELKEKLLAEKQQQKKYLMQQLLTGKKRLPGFDGEWKKVKLSTVLEERKEKKQEQELRICSVAVQKGVIDQIEHLGRSYAASNTSNYGVAYYGDIIYTKSPTGDFPYGIIKQNLLHEKVAVSPLYGIFKPVTFGMGYILHTYFQDDINAKNYLLPIIQKGAKNTINITNETFLSNALYLPLNPNEQEEISKIFEAADHEIDLLQKDIEQEKQKKKALMQLLLTGIVRVNI